MEILNSFSYLIKARGTNTNRFSKRAFKIFSVPFKEGRGQEKICD